MSNAQRLERLQTVFLVTVMVLGLAMFGCIHVLREPLFSPRPATVNPPVSVSNVNLYGLWGAVNQVRTDAKMPPLLLSQGLTAAASAMCADMVAKNYWNHNDPAGTTPWHFITSAGVTYKNASENLVQGYSHTATITAALQRSAEYKANLLNAAYTQTGFAACRSADFQHKGPRLLVV